MATTVYVPIISVQTILILLPSRVITLRFGFFLYSSILNCFILFVFLFQIHDRSADIRITLECVVTISDAKSDDQHAI